MNSTATDHIIEIIDRIMAIDSSLEITQRVKRTK